MQQRHEICPYCGLSTTPANMIRHLKSHENGNWSKRQSSQHLDHDDLFCKFCGKEYKNKTSLIQHEIRCPCNLNRIQVIVPGFNDIGKPGYPSWNKGKTKFDDPRIDAQARKYSENHKKGLHKDQSGDNNPSKRPEVREKISKTAREKAARGEWHTSLAKNMHHTYKGMDLDGKWEVAFAIYLDLLGIPYQRNIDRFPYEYQGKSSTYTPDFYLNSTEEYVEIKGRENGRDHAKWKQFPADKRLVVLKEKDLVALGVLDSDIMQLVDYVCEVDSSISYLDPSLDLNHQKNRVLRLNQKQVESEQLRMLKDTERVKKLEEYRSKLDPRYTGVHNSSYGSHWITNGVENRKWRPSVESTIPDGWRLGRVMKFG